MKPLVKRILKYDGRMLAAEILVLRAGDHPGCIATGHAGCTALLVLVGSTVGFHCLRHGNPVIAPFPEIAVPIHRLVGDSLVTEVLCA